MSPFPDQKLNSAGDVNLTNCDREPIHVPAAIQPHGVLFAVAEDDLTVQQVSRNSMDFLGIEAKNCWATQFPDSSAGHRRTRSGRR